MGASDLPATGSPANGNEEALVPSSSHSRKSPDNLIDNGGAVLPVSHVYVIWWGDPASWSSDISPGIASFLSGLNGSTYVNTASQYMRGAPISTTYEGSASDTSAPPSDLYNSVLGAEVEKEYGPNLDPDGLYIMYVSSPPTDNACAWHSFDNSHGPNIVMATILDATEASGCEPSNNFHLKQSAGLIALANATAHEFMESLTDPLAGPGSWGWLDSQGNEMADKCAWRFRHKVTLENQTNWELQEEWSNAKRACVQLTR